MGLPKGKTNNPNGRPIGALNKCNKNIRSLITGYFQKNILHILESFNDLSPKDRLIMAEKILKYTISNPENHETKESTTDNPYQLSKLSYNEVMDMHVLMIKAHKDITPQDADEWVKAIRNSDNNKLIMFREKYAFTFESNS